MMQIALYRGTLAQNPSARLFDRLICWWTRGPYSHAELVLSAPHHPAGWSLCGSSSIRDHGVRTKVMRLDRTKWTIIDLPHDAIATAAARDWFESRLGAPYDWLAIFGFLLHRRFGRARKWYCSEAVCCALGMPETRLTPNELAASLGVTW